MRELTKVGVAFIALIVVIMLMSGSLKLMNKYRTVISHDVNATVLSSIHMEARKEAKRVKMDDQMVTQVTIFDESYLARMRTEEGYVVTCDIDKDTFESIPDNPFFTLSMTRDRFKHKTTCFNLKSIKM